MKIQISNGIIVPVYKINKVFLQFNMISGVTIIRNGLKYDYPFIESLKSLIPLCDEVIVVAGNSEDETNTAILALNEPKIKLIHTVWDEQLRTGGKILALQTNIGIQAAKGNWIIYLQGDEVFHESAKDKILTGISLADKIEKIDGLLFPYFHFYGDYNHVKSERGAYRFEIRVFKNHRSIYSYKDAQGFRTYNNFDQYSQDESLGKKLNVFKIETPIYHYGYVKPPTIMQSKVRNFSKLWHSDEAIKKKLGENNTFDYSDYESLVPFKSEHPTIMRARVAHQNWEFIYDPSRIKMTFKIKVLDWIEKITGYRLFEYKNYKLFKK